MLKRLALSVAAALALSTTGCMMFAKAPQNLDYSRTQLSGRGLYRGSFQPAGDSIRVGRMHSWRLHLETADGKPVDDATIAVDGGMPQHGHGLPTKPRVTKRLGDGEHVIRAGGRSFCPWMRSRQRASSHRSRSTHTRGGTGIRR